MNAEISTLTSESKKQRDELVNQIGVTQKWAMVEMSRTMYFALIPSQNFPVIGLWALRSAKYLLDYSPESPKEITVMLENATANFRSTESFPFMPEILNEVEEAIIALTRGLKDEQAQRILVDMRNEFRRATFASKPGL